MKRFVSFILVIGFIVYMASCSSERIEEPMVKNQQKTEMPTTHGSQNPSSFIDDKGMEIAKADFIAALEGAYVGMDMSEWSTDIELNKKFYSMNHWIQKL